MRVCVEVGGDGDKPHALARGEARAGGGGREPRYKIKDAHTERALSGTLRPHGRMKRRLGSSGIVAVSLRFAAGSVGHSETIGTPFMFDMYTW